MPHLSVNVNKIALLRNQRAGDTPSPVRLARIALDAGAQGITVHPRPDQRHIRPDDVADLAALLREEFPQAEFNIEGNPFTGDWISLVEAARPDQCTLVPDSPEQATSDHGWDIARDADRLTPIVRRLRDAGCRVSLFMDPDPDTIAHAAQTGADRVELYTESYARTHASGVTVLYMVMETFLDAARAAQAAGLGVNAGHDLSLANLPAFVEAIPGLQEVSIGHALIAEALELGMAETVRRYVEVLEQNIPPPRVS